MNKPLLFGHRGSPEEVKENTLVSFQRALDVKADGVELDIHKTKDGQLAVVHNTEFSIENKETQYVFDYTYADIKKIFPDLPLLQDVIDLCRDRAKVEIEIKREDKETVDLCIDAIMRNGFQPYAEVISFHPTVLNEVKLKNPDIVTGLIFNPFPEWMQAKHQEMTILDAVTFIDANVAHIRIDDLNPNLIAAIKKSGRKVQASRVDTVEMMRKAFSLGVDQITTDKPGLARAELLKYQA